MTTVEWISDTSYDVPRTIVLVGMMGSGKSAIGRTLSAALNVPFLDSDEEIERAAQATIADIFERDGEPFFRQREAEVIARLLSGPATILSTGGGAYLAESNRETIAARATAVWLDASLSLLWDRVRHKDTRPLLNTPKPRETLARIYQERTPVYSQAELRLPISPSASIEDTTKAAIDLLLSHGKISVKKVQNT